MLKPEPEPFTWQDIDLVSHLLIESINYNTTYQGRKKMATCHKGGGETWFKRDGYEVRVEKVFFI